MWGDGKVSILETLNELWLKFNEYENKLAQALGRTRNIVGEYAEHLALQYYGGRLLEVSGCSADLEDPSGNLYQVKARKVATAGATSLNIIRSWDFDFLVVIIFKEDGKVWRAIEAPVEVAKAHAKPNSHQNGEVITTTKKFLSDPRNKDLSIAFSALNR